MQLTKEQLQKIETYLDSKNFKFIDLRIEVLDHIISEIEEKMNKEAKTFQEIFAPIKQKWNLQLRETSSMFFGVGFYAPKIVIQKAKKLFWKHYAFLLTSYFLPFLLLTHFNFKVENPTEFNFFILLKGVIILTLIGFIYMLFSYNNKIKTTYGFVLKSQSLSVFVGLILAFTIFSNTKKIEGIHIGLFCSFLTSTFNYFHFYQKHKKAIYKYQV